METLACAVSPNDSLRLESHTLCVIAFPRGDHIVSSTYLVPGLRSLD